MDKIFSSRLDESAIAEMDRVVHRLKMTKKKFLEDAIHRMAQSVLGPGEADVWRETCGAWKRKESPEKLARKIRSEMNSNFERHHR